MRRSIYISSHCPRRRPPSDTLTRVRSVRGVTWFGLASPGLGSSAPFTPVRAPRRGAPGRRRRLDARSGRREAAEQLGAERAFESAEALVQRRRRRSRAHLHPEPPARAARRAALAAGKHVICEKPLAIDAARRQRWSIRPPGGPQAAVPFVYRYYPTVREARERVARGDGSGATDPRHLPAGLAAAPGGRQLARRRGRSAAPRARSPTSARTGAISPSSSPASASRGCARAC